MHQRYDDIFSRIDQAPYWFDEYAVPRYCVFTPDKLANIYAGEAVLAEVTCQVCKHLFRVAFSGANWNSGTIADAIRSRTLKFGDPPNYCCNNADMSSEPRRVIEYWRRNDPRYTRQEGNSVIVADLAAYVRWTRDSTLEVDIRPDWVDPL